ncbi:MAG: EI24 domain-containing protein [Myxococcales bacterium]
MDANALVPGRAKFGPPTFGLLAFFWALLQFPRALLWQLRERELRKLAMLPNVVTLAVGTALAAAAVLGAEPLLAQLMTRGTGVLAGAAWMSARIVLTLVLVAAAAVLTWHVQSFIADPFLERMALYVQRVVDGDAPLPEKGALHVLRSAALGVFPRVKRFVAWALSSLAAVTLVLVPTVGPVLVVVAQTAIASLFLAHGTIVENRARLGLPRLFLVKEPALVLGLALALSPLVLIPPLMLVTGGPVAIAGALVALGAKRRRGSPSGPPPVSEPTSAGA